MRSTLIASTFVCFLILTGCEDDPAPSKDATTAASSGEHASHQHAPAGVTPGSHEDWCGEHQVPESECTRCNPSLEAAFKATGDWCPEHNLPESQCKLCNPDLKIERPPKEK
jgi:hypothetical protein